MASWVGDALSLPKVNFATMLFGAFAVVFVAVEAVIPWFCGGSTIGGAYVHMTCESRERSTGFRLLFYVARCLTLGLAIATFWLAFPLLGLFYAIARKMPYDHVP